MIFLSEFFCIKFEEAFKNLGGCQLILELLFIVFKLAEIG